MMRQFQDNSYLFGGNAPFVEELYESYLDNPQSVSDSWRAYFDQLQVLPGSGGASVKDVAHAPVVESFVQRAKMNRFGKPAAADQGVSERLQVAALLLVTSYRIAGSR